MKNLAPTNDVMAMKISPVIPNTIMVKLNIGDRYLVTRLTIFISFRTF